MKKLGFGCMRLPLTDPADRGSVDIAAFEKLVDRFLEEGFSYFDTAYKYCAGNSETALRKALDPADRGSVDIAAFEKLVDRFLEEGFSYFDTAYKYCAGNSETALRKALVDRYPRERYILTTKLSNEYMHTPQEQQKVFDEQLDKLGCGYFDYYLLHNQGSVNYRVSEELGSFDFIRKQKEKGLVRHIGMSYHDNAALLDEILTLHPELEVVQLQINYLDWENESIQARKCYEVARKHNKPVLVMEPLKGGTLAQLPPDAETVLRAVHPDWTPAGWALRFAASHEGIMAVLSGMNASDQLEDNMRFLSSNQPLDEREMQAVMKAGELLRSQIAVPCTGCGMNASDQLEDNMRFLSSNQPLDEREMQAVMKAGELLRSQIAVPCTGCRYCTVTCPKDIPIPDYLSLLQEGHATTQVVYYFNYSQGHGRAKDCIECGVCESHCPQHIQIRDYLKVVSNKFDGFAGWR